MRKKTYMSILLSVAAALLLSCMTVNFDQKKTPSVAISSAVAMNTTLGQDATNLARNQAVGTSGFYPLLDGIQALALRLALAEAAEKSIDLQYYLIKNDTVGRLFIGALISAADRGVKVRIILDDIFTKGYDTGMLALDAHPNIDIRLFNPFANRQFRVGDIFRFAQVNRRLHNKSFTVDNHFTIIGGRNIADEYFGARNDLNFRDADVLATGPITQEVSTMFDLYWNSRPAIPVTQVAKSKRNLDDHLAKMRAAIIEQYKSIKTSKYAAAIVEDIEKLVDDTAKMFIWAPYELVYDAPEKVMHKEADNAASITTPLRKALLAAKRQLVIISPYFVPLKSGVNTIAELQKRGVEVIIITNSLASNNHTLVHAGYTPYRKAILQTGAKLYEAQYTGAMQETERLGIGDSGATLHTKAFFVDGAATFVGSFNFDPRSANLNTELGVIIYSEHLARASLYDMQARLDALTYEVVLDSQNRIRWLDRSGDKLITLNSEPDTGNWRRFYAKILTILPIRSQL